ncbi:reverse transcriptase domain-containing protein [Paracoccus alkenifer]|uniref:Reverse transcriptase (RNA-dependent DNA polymerase) n=1 Tax=Paracoccus alkenifer TaxID=65735 RepID=A0A1H6KE43_9RHOB|nr:reverse transcriptase domain-containing protein [Paracoccus alkenifer]SEH69730.1 Reverse transcriptase (RNA-dependent DNA polymerase) [Paracoccus alkenifer]
MEDEFDFTAKNLKHYPHFDAPITLREIRNLVTDRERVATNSFYPFFLYEDSWQPYRSTDAAKPDKKTRPIRYGARRDAYIFAFYRRKLSRLYEARLREIGIEDCPIAYRQVLKPGRGGGKCNIDFAKDAFDEIDRLGDCVAIALDIKGYFENLDHGRIKRIWCDLLGVERLPPDHYAVFQNITKYNFVDQRSAYSRLGYFGMRERNGHMTLGFLIPFRDMPKQICSNSDFRAKICGGDPKYGPSLVQKNVLPHGVPQGAPISDLIANFYLLEFDRVMADYARVRGGRYMRYSDDILLILRGGSPEAREAIAFATTEMRKHGPELRIKDAKTCVAQFQRIPGGLQFHHLKQRSDEVAKNGFEYLGFRYDGRRVYVRDSTISRFYRKVAGAAKRDGRLHAEKNPTLDAGTLISSFNFSLFSQRFSKVKKTNLTGDYRSWTFYSYLKRSAEAFGPKGDRILQQARGFDKHMKRKVSAAIVRSVTKGQSSKQTQVGCQPIM